MILVNKTIRLFLDGIGRREEYEFYLDRFQLADTPAFALVCPDRETVAEAAEMLVFDLQFLLELGLVPVVVLAGGDAATVAQGLAGLGESCRVRPAGAEGSVEDFVREAGGDGSVPVLVRATGLADTLLELVPRIAPRVHLVRPRGALRAGNGEIIYHHYTERDNLLEPGADDRPVVDLARDLIAARPMVHISITSAINLLKEIFTVKGAGSVVRRGRVVDHWTRAGDVDQPRLMRLLVESFGKQPAGEAFLSAVSDYYIERDYRGAALIEPQPVGHYLSKFAVGTEARGEGLAQELWQEMGRRHPALFWRSREANPINQWYEKKADGRQRIDGWRIFWRGIDPGHIDEAIRYCRRRPTDFMEDST